MVPISSVLGGSPFVCPTLSRLNGLLSKAGYTIRPRGVVLFDTMEMDGGVERHVIVNGKLGRRQINHCSPNICSFLTYFDIITLI